MSGIRYIRPGDCQPTHVEGVASQDRSHRIACERSIFPPPAKDWEGADPGSVWSEYICEGTAIGKVAAFKRWGWAVAFGKVICPGCIAALARDERPTQQEYAKWAKEVAAKSKESLKRTKTEVPEVVLSTPIERGLDLRDEPDAPGGG